MLGSHGLFTWGDTAYESYINTLEVIERCAEYLEDQLWKERDQSFGGQKIQSLPKEERLKKAAALGSDTTRFLFIMLITPLQGEGAMIGHFTDDDRVLAIYQFK